MADEEILLKAVLDAPDDDAPRLAYADWCDAQPDEALKARAEFVRAQITIARTEPAIVNTGGVYRLQDRSSKLEHAYCTQWTAPIGRYVHSSTFLRGFVEHVQMDARSFLDHASLLFAHAPIRHLDLTGVRNVNEELFASPYFRRIRTLRMSECGLHDIHLELLAASPEFASLRWLGVPGNCLTLRGADALARSPYLKELEYADFQGNPVDPAERVGEDSGAIVATWMPPEGEELERRYGNLPWLHRDRIVNRAAL